MSPLRILLADDHALVRAGLRSIVASFPDVEIVGETGDGKEAVRLSEQLQPDVVLMDVSMPGLNGLEATRRITRQHSRPRVVMLSMHADKEYVHQALAAGAAGYLLKNADPAELEMALRAVGRGEAWLSPAISRTVTVALIRGEETTGGGAAQTQSLTPRQREVIQLIAEGHSTKGIARLLQLSVKTVETHRAQIMNRLGIHDVAGLVRYAIRTGIVRAET